MHLHKLGMLGGEIRCLLEGCSYSLRSVSDLTSGKPPPDPMTREILAAFQKKSDEEVLRASKERPFLFEILVTRYWTKLQRAAWGVLHNYTEAEDVVQESFLKMYLHTDSYREQEGIKFKSWAYKITINSAITRYRKIQHGEWNTDDPELIQMMKLRELHEILDEGRLIDLIAARTHVSQILNEMPEHLRLVLVKFYLEEKTYWDIVEEEKISLAALKMRLFRARELFRSMNVLTVIKDPNNKASA